MLLAPWQEAGVQEKPVVSLPVKAPCQVGSSMQQSRTGMPLQMFAERRAAICTWQQETGEESTDKSKAARQPTGLPHLLFCRPRDHLICSGDFGRTQGPAARSFAWTRALALGAHRPGKAVAWIGGEEGNAVN